MTKEEWLEERKKGIGGSDAITVLGRNKYKSIVQLWREKTGRAEAEDISNRPYVKYGTDMEPVLRESFKIKHPEFLVTHKENTIIKHKKYPFLFASLDGEILDIETGEIGILEIKTANIKNSAKADEWKDRIPDNYYCQILHYLNVTGYSFVYLFAELNYSEEYQANKTFIINRADEDVQASIKYLEEQEIKFWKEYVEKDKEPPLILPEI